KGDAIAGIKTLPLALGKKNARNLLLGIQIVSHALLLIAVVLGYIAFEPVILLYSFIIGILYITDFSTSTENESRIRRFKRLFMIDGESTSIVSLRALTGILLP
ncbi:MAG: prenyltransferase, partial [Methanohalobium sp.]